MHRPLLRDSGRSAIAEQATASQSPQEIEKPCRLRYARAHPSEKVEGEAAVYGAASVLPDEVLCEAMRGYIDVKLTAKKREGPA